MKRRIERGVFLLAAAAMVIAAAVIPTRRVQEDTLPEVYVYRGYAAAADAPWSEKSLDFAVKRFSHLLEAYFPGSEHVYMCVIPDKAAFMETPEGYTPAGAAETAGYLAQRLPVEIIDIEPENLQAVLQGMRDLVVSGSVAYYFKDCVVDAAAKTGTAQTGGKVSNGVFVAFAPYDDPQIALAVVIEKGGSGGALASTAVQILNAYFTSVDEAKAVVGENMLIQ